MSFFGSCVLMGLKGLWLLDFVKLSFLKRVVVVIVGLYV